MLVLMSLLGVMAVSAMVGAVVVASRDGYRQVPSISRY